MKILIVGSGGFLGSHVTEKLQNNELSDYEKTSLLLSINGLAAGLRNTG